MPKPKYLFLIIMIFLLMGKYSLSRKERIRTAPTTSINDSILYLRGNTTPFTIEVRVLDSIITTPLIRDLINCESGRNIYAENLMDVHYWKNGTESIGSYGILQFGKPTFQEFCVIKYGLRNDLFDPEIQILCAEKMISENLGDKWGCWKK